MDDEASPSVDPAPTPPPEAARPPLPFMRRFFRRDACPDARPVRVRGHAFLGALVSTLGIAVFVPPAAHFIESERAVARPARASPTALRLADAGILRGMRKLGESDLVWHRARVGTPIPHYNDDLDYSDQKGGLYRVRFVPGPTPKDVTVVATGLDRETREARALQAVFTHDGLRTALQTEGDMALGPTVHVHWGPAVARGSLLLGSADPFPRKFALGRIVAWEPTERIWRDRRPFDVSLGEPPRLDLDYYRKRARATQLPLFPQTGGRLEWNGEGSWPAMADPPGSGYFRTSLNGGQGLRFQASPDGRPYALSDPRAVIYVRNDSEIPVESLLARSGAFFDIEALILEGPANHLRLESQSGTLRAVLPPWARREYGPEARETWNQFAPLTELPGQCCMGLENAAVRGIVWVDGDLIKGDPDPVSLLGSVRVGGVIEARNLSIYYEDAVALSARLDGKSLFRADITEIPVRW